MYTFSFKESNTICVIGDIMVDHYIYGSCTRISPEAPVQVVDVISEEYLIGGAGNVIRNLVSFGAKSRLISVCGNDEACEIIKKSLEKLPLLNYKLIIDDSRKTTIKTRVMSSKHQLLRLDHEHKHAVNADIIHQLIKAIETNVSDISILIVSDYCKGVLNSASVKAILDVCNNLGIKTVVDSKNTDLSIYKNATIIKPNKKEASLATGINIVDDASLEAACKKISEQTNCEAVVITLSEEGMAIYSGNQLTKIPTKALDVFDVTGAGDTVIASIAFALQNNLTLLEACDFANHAAAVVVAKAGSATATLKEVEDFYLN